MADNRKKGVWNDSAEKVLKDFAVQEDKGLDDARVLQQKDKYGLNKLAEEDQKSIFALILEQFEDPLVRILLVSAVISFALTFFDDAKEEGWTAYVEPFVILAILIANAFVGVWQESNAEAALDALKALQPVNAMALRNGRWETIEAEELVPGDIVEVATGSKVPADMRIVKVLTTTISIEQSQLTGESQSVLKDVDAVEGECVIQAKTNMLFSSTAVSSGKAIGIVTHTGTNTEIGEIQKDVAKAGEDAEKTPLGQKLDEFSNMLTKVIAIICLVVWIINFKHFSDPAHGGNPIRGCIYYFKIAVALAVAAIPEGLPAVITTCLSLGTKKMAQKNAIVRKLPSVETLGCTTVICSDKTGTLTTNEMCCKKVAFATNDGRMETHDVEGTSYQPVGKVEGLESCWNTHKALLSRFSKCGVIANESRLVVDEQGQAKRQGEPTDTAIRVLVEKLGCDEPSLMSRCHQKPNRSAADAMAFSDFWTKGGEPLATLEFNRDRKSMSVIFNEGGQQGNALYCKGAPESVMARCTTFIKPDGSKAPMDAKAREVFKATQEQFAKAALRTIALACKLPEDMDEDLRNASSEQLKHAPKLKDVKKFAEVEKNMLFLGMVGIIDPPRKECKGAIKECRDAGINVIMITGDNKDTAQAIAHDLGILSCLPANKGKSYTGQEFFDMTEEDQKKMLSNVMEEKYSEGAVFSRTEPKHKQQIVKILKNLGEISAMTGDGVNDAPALKQADIGIAMGITGTEVAKDASDMVLADDNFKTIVDAVEEGRSIYNNMKAFIRYLISSNIGEVASIFFTAAMGIPEGLAPVQLLWVNLVTDGLPATALGFNPPDLNVMTKPPRGKDENLISGWVFFRYMVIGIYVGFATVGIFVYWFVYDGVDGHTLVSIPELMSWGQCPNWTGFAPTWGSGIEGLTFEKDACSYFTVGKVKASTLSLTVLVIIEMLNAFNALSEDGSLLVMPPWRNPLLILACCGSVSVHFVILYVPFLAKIFGVCALTMHDWKMVMLFSVPILLLDEILKCIGRMFNQQELDRIEEERRKREEKKRN